MADTVFGFLSFAVIIVSVAFWIRALRRVEIPENRGVYIAAWIVAATLGVAALLGTPGWFAGTLAGVSIFACAFILLTVAIGGQKVGEHAIQVGAKIPAFAATDEHGQSFDSGSLVGTPALIKFFRGHW
jgi:hypothetical protein